MISRFEWLYIQASIKKIEYMLFNFENGGEEYGQEGTKEHELFLMYRKYLAFNKLSDEDKNAIFTQWDEYYQMCFESEPGQLFKKASKALEAFDYKTVKEYAQKAKQNIGKVFIERPSTTDPGEMLQKMQPYFDAKRRLKLLKAVYDEYREVYQSKEKKQKEEDLLS